ncbi:MAG: RNA methyltransferase [Clostridia bacterium]
MISSSSNQRIKDIKKSVANGNIIFLDTQNLIEEVFASSWLVEFIVYENGKNEEFISQFNCEKIEVSHDVLKSLTNVESSSGVAAAVKIQNGLPQEPLGSYVVLENVQDPGNVGTIIRSAVGSGFLDIILIGSAKVMNPKTFRASSGAIFKANISELKNIDEFFEINKNWNLPLIGTSMTGENIFSCTMPKEFGLVLGNEGQGISKEMLKKCNKIVSIPMINGLESLNVGVAGSIIMFEKKFGGKHVRT